MFFRTNNSTMEIIDRKYFKLTSMRETTEVYHFDIRQIYHLFINGGKKQRIQERDRGYVELTFIIKDHPQSGKHITSAGGQIATYISKSTYSSLLRELRVALGMIKRADVGGAA